MSTRSRNNERARERERERERESGNCDCNREKSGKKGKRKKGKKKEEKSWLKICKPTSARSVTRGGWKFGGTEGQYVSSARVHLLRHLVVARTYFFFPFCDPAREEVPSRDTGPVFRPRETRPIFVSCFEDKHEDETASQEAGFIRLTFRSISAVEKSRPSA